MMLIPFADAVQRIAALIDGGLLGRLAGNEWLKENCVDTVVYWHDKQARNLLVWLIHNGALTPSKEDKTGITLFIDKEAKAFFRLYDENTKAWNHGEYGYDAIADDAVYFEAGEFDLLEGILSHKQTSFLDWQLAYIWAGKEPPLGYEIALSGQNEPHPLPRTVEDRLKRIRQSLPADGQTGRLRLYAWAGFPAFANQQGYPLPNTSHVIDSTSNENEIQPSHPSKDYIGQQNQEGMILGSPPVIQYLAAKPQIEALFPGVTNKEILIWVETAAYAAPFGAINKQPIPRNANGTILNFGSLDKDGARDGEDDDRVDSILVPLYFFEQEWQEANPERWLTYQQLKEVVFEAGISESELMASILTCPGNVDIYDPIPRRSREIETVNRKDKPKTALYRAGWIQETFPRVDLGRFRKVDVSAGGCAKNMGELNGHSGSLGGGEQVKPWEAVTIDSQQE